MEKGMKKIFLNCQVSSATHPKLIKNLIAIYLKSDFKLFFEEFTFLTKHALIHGDKQPAVEKTLSFVAKFATSLKSEKDDKEVTIEETLEDDEDAEIDPFLAALFEFLLKNHEANSKSVRFRVCQLINKTLNCMGEQATIDDELYGKLYDTMLNRLMDKVPAIRVQAIFALARLQDPRNKECVVIKAYLFHLSMDPNPEVRRAVLNNISITFHTLPGILDRIRDVRDLVRRQAYIILAQKVHIRSFTIAQRVLLISEGLKDRSVMVQNAVKKNLLQSWLRLVDGSILNLLKCLDVEASTEGAEMAIACMFEDVPYPKLLESFTILNEKKLIDYENLSPEAVLYWKCLTKYLRSEKADEFLEEVLPDLSVFCEYLKDYMLMNTPDEEDPQDTAMKLIEKDFICQQLISMARQFDLSDEVGRQSLKQLVRTMFLNSSVGESCLKELSEVFALLHSPVARIAQLAEIISDLREPELEVSKTIIQETPIIQKEPSILSECEQRKNKMKLAKVRVEINEIREELENCVRTLNLEKAQELKIELKELEEEFTVLSSVVSRTPYSTPAALAPPPCSQAKLPDDEDEPKQLDDPQTLSRSLHILCEVLSSSDIVNLNSTLRSLHDNLIVPCLKSEDLTVRKYAVKALLLVCLVSNELAKQHLILIVQISQMDVEEIQLVALQGLFDLFMLYGIEEFNSAAEDMETSVHEISENKEIPNSQSPVAGSMISLLTKMLETGSCDTRTLVAEGLCKLLLTSRILSSKLITHLIILWYNPNTEDDQLLRHILGVFFPLYASLGSTNQESLSSAVLPTLETLFNAPPRSPLSDIDVDDVTHFLISITSPNCVSKQATEVVNVHDTLVFGLCSEIIAFPDREYNRQLAKSLTLLCLTPTNFSSLKQIDILCQKMIKNVIEKPVLNYIEKFHKTIKNYLKLAPAIEIEEETLVNDSKDLSQKIDDTIEISVDKTVLSARRKRTLYTTMSDMELISDIESETETPFKKISKPPVMTTDDEDTSVFESAGEDFIDENACVDTADEIELSSVLINSPATKERNKLTSSDLFVSASQESNQTFSPLEKKKSHIRSNLTITTRIDESPDIHPLNRVHISETSTDSNVTPINIRTSSRTQKGATLATSEKRLSSERPSRNKKMEVFDLQSSSSSPSFYTTGSTDSLSSNSSPPIKKKRRSKLSPKGPKASAVKKTTKAVKDTTESSQSGPQSSKSSGKSSESIKSSVSGSESPKLDSVSSQSSISSSSSLTDNSQTRRSARLSSQPFTPENIQKKTVTSIKSTSKKSASSSESTPPMTHGRILRKIGTQISPSSSSSQESAAARPRVSTRSTKGKSRFP